MHIPSLRFALPRSAAVDGRRVRSPIRWLVRIAIWGLLLAVAAEALRMYLFGNVHAVVPGRVYRSAQLSPDRLRSLINKHGIRTVVNLRGYCAQFDWYQDESRVLNDLNVSQEDVTFSANTLPPTTELRRLVEVFDRSEHPLLLHCRQGADRTGLASALYMMLYTNTDYATARRQCGFRYGHFPVLRTLAMDQFFELYEAWLARTGISHAPEHLRRWLLEEYRPDPAPGHLELLDPGTIPAGEAATLRVRAFNRSNVVWEFKTGWATGVHVYYSVWDPKNQCVWNRRAGFFRASVAPGDSVDIDLPLPPLAEPGDYRIVVGLADQHLTFCQLGSDLLERVIRVQPKQGR